MIIQYWCPNDLVAIASKASDEIEAIDLLELIEANGHQVSSMITVDRFEDFVSSVLESTNQTIDYIIL